MIEIRDSWCNRDWGRKNSTILNRMVPRDSAGIGLHCYRWRWKESSTISWSFWPKGWRSRTECWLHWYPFVLKLVHLAKIVAHPQIVWRICLVRSFWVPRAMPGRVPCCHAVWRQGWSCWHSSIDLKVSDDGYGIAGRYVFWWKQTSVCRTYEL